MDLDDVETAYRIVKAHVRATGDVSAYKALACLDDLRTSASGSGNTVMPNAGYCGTAMAAARLGCSERWVRQIAPSIGGVHRQGRWLIPISALPDEQEEDCDD